MSRVKWATFVIEGPGVAIFDAWSESVSAWYKAANDFVEQITGERIAAIGRSFGREQISGLAMRVGNPVPEGMRVTKDVSTVEIDGKPVKVVGLLPQKRLAAGKKIAARIDALNAVGPENPSAAFGVERGDWFVDGRYCLMGIGHLGDQRVIRIPMNHAGEPLATPHHARRIAEWEHAYLAEKGTLPPSSLSSEPVPTPTVVGEVW